MVPVFQVVISVVQMDKILGIFTKIFNRSEILVKKNSTKILEIMTNSFEIRPEEFAY